MTPEECARWLADGPHHDEIKAHLRRLAALEAENARLRDQLAVTAELAGKYAKVAYQHRDETTGFWIALEQSAREALGEGGGGD